MSRVKMVELELKMEVREDMRAASMTASIRPLTPTGIFSFTSLTKARFVQPALELQTRMQSSGVAHPTSSGKSTLAPTFQLSTEMFYTEPRTIMAADPAAGYRQQCRFSQLGKPNNKIYQMSESVILY